MLTLQKINQIMRKYLLLIVAALMASCCGPKTTELTVEDFNGKAAEYVEKPVTITGVAKHICANSGTKLFLGSPEGGDAMVTVFTGEGMEPFDRTTVGKTYTVNGIVKVTVTIDDAYLDEWEREVVENGIREGDHICETEQQAAGVEIDENEENPQLKQIETYREKIVANGGNPIIQYHVECQSFDIN